MAMIRRFVNIVSSNRRSSVYSLHQLDISEHLFYPSTPHAHQAAKDGTLTMERLQELPPPCTHFERLFQTGAADRSKSFCFGLVGGCHSSEGRILCMDKDGHSPALRCGPAKALEYPMPPRFKAPASAVSLSILPQAGAKEGAMYIMHGLTADGLEPNSRFDALRFGTYGTFSMVEAWHWQSLPLPPFVHGPDHRRRAPITSYTVVEGGRTICLSLEGVGTYCFDTVQGGEWWPAADSLLPFAGRAEYIYDLNLWLGLSSENPRELCVASGLGAIGLKRAPKLRRLWRDEMTPDGEWKTSLLNLGSGRFAIAKVLEGEFLLTGVEVRPTLQTFQHKSIRYVCTEDRIHQVI